MPVLCSKLSHILNSSVGISEAGLRFIDSVDTRFLLFAILGDWLVISSLE